MVSAQSLIIMRFHVTIYSTNVDDDERGKEVHGQLRRAVNDRPGLLAVHVSTSCDHREQSHRVSDNLYKEIVRKQRSSNYNIRSM